MRSCELLGAYAEGRVQLRSPEGLTWWQPARAPGPGWYWWSGQGLCLHPADYPDLLRLPLKTLQVGRHSLRLAEGYDPDDWVKAWWDGGRGWVVGPAVGPTPPRGARGELVVRRAVERAGGELLQASANQQGWKVTWRRAGQTHTSQVDHRLNILSAGFCLSGQDRIQDLTSLVSLIHERNQVDEDAYLRGGDIRW
ncbi:MAG: hypothetical protein U0931_32180 [Vulcanimicrobiota bacterium]